MTDNFDSIYDHPQVKELLDRIADLEKLITGVKPQFEALTASYNGVKAEREDYLKSVNETLAGFDNQMRLFDRQRREIEQQIRSAESIKADVQRTITETVDALKAQQLNDEVEQKWQNMMTEWEYAWTEAIRKFQLECVRFIIGGFEADLHGVLVADQMGLGKTLEATASLDVIQGMPSYIDIISKRCPDIDLDHPESTSVLWLCPTSIKESTVREIRKWSPERQTIKLEGSPEVRNHIVRLAHDNGMVLIVGYEQLRDRGGKAVTPELFEHQWPVVVMDEAHKFKSDTSSTFTRVEEISNNAGFILPMTGTPIMNRPEELWAILHMLTLKGKYQGKFDVKWRFINEYCWSYGGTASFAGGGYDRLIKDVQDMVIRRRKDEVFSDMPDKVREVRFVELSKAQRDVYDQMRDKFLIWLDEQHTDAVSAQSVLAQLTRLRQLALYPAGVKITTPEGKEMVVDCTEGAKLDEAMDIVEELLGNDEKVLIFSNYNEPLKVLKDRIESKFTYQDQPVEAALIIGGMTDVNRSNKVDRFNDPDSKLRVVLGNIAAMGIGLNLQGACSDAIFLDLGWNPGVNEQAEDRLHRQGQKNAVTIHIIQAEDTVDAFIAQKLEDKAAMIEGVMERSELRKAIQNGLI